MYEVSSNQHELMVRVLTASGGVPLECMVPKGYSGKIADVLFKKDGVIAEVKSITSERTRDPEVSRALGEMLSLNANAGAPVIFGTKPINVADLPTPVAEKAMRIFGKRVQSEVTRANSQIKASKLVLDLPNAYGLLVFITPPFRLNRWSVGWLVHNATKGGACRSINGIMIVESPVAVVSDTPLPRDSYLSFHSRGGRQLSMVLKKRIGQAWGVITEQEMKHAKVDDFFQPTPGPTKGFAGR